MGMVDIKTVVLLIYFLYSDMSVVGIDTCVLFCVILDWTECMLSVILIFHNNSAYSKYDNITQTDINSGGCFLIVPQMTSDYMNEIDMYWISS